MSSNPINWKTVVAALLVSIGLLWGPAALAQPTATLVPGTPALGLGSFNLKAMGYSVEEYFLTGVATSYRLKGAPTPDGRWDSEAAGTAPYATRIVVVRPTDAKRFNGTVVVEWLNVTGGLDATPDWTYTHKELIRSGYAYVAVSAQKVGVEGASPTAPGLPLKRLNPVRYAPLAHPGDIYAFDMYSQAGQVVRGGAVMGGLTAKRILASGESQSAIFMTTYINAIDPLARVFDGFFVHSRFGGAPTPEGAGTRGGPNAQTPTAVKLRTDLRVPVMTLITETDLIGNQTSGFWAARQPDSPRLRAWEVAGTAHTDNYMYLIGGIDDGNVPIGKLAALWGPNPALLGRKLAKPMNAAPQHHYVAMAAMAHLDTWVRTGRSPPKSPRLEITPPAAPGQAPSLVLDANGNARGGIRSPWVDAPTMKLSGMANAGGAFAGLVGSSEPFDAAKLAALYPGGKADYLKQADASLTRALKAGFILPADAAEIRALTAATYAAQAGATAPP